MRRLKIGPGRRRTCRPAPFTAAEDQVIIDAVNVGLEVKQCSIAYKHLLPRRSFGEIANRKLDLIKMGKATRPPEL